MPPALLHVARKNPIHRVNLALYAKLIEAQGNTIEQEFPSAGALCERVFHDLQLAILVPDDYFDHSAASLSDRRLPLLAVEFDAILTAAGTPSSSASQMASTIGQRIHLLRAFARPDDVIASMSAKIREITDGFPRTATDIDVGNNPGDVLDPYILAATQTLLYQGDFSQAIGATVAHKAIMMIEGLLGHLHEDVIGDMRGNIRIPEPRGSTNQEILDPFTNPFPGADVLQPPIVAGDPLKFHQVKSKTGSAKGGDGARLGGQLRKLQVHYGGDIYYDALIGNTLRGHRSMGGALTAAEGLIVLVGASAFQELTRSPIGPELLLRVYQAAFSEVALATGYSVETVIATIVATFAARSAAAGEGFLESILNTSVGGTLDQQDSRTYVAPGRSRRRR